MRSDPTPPRSCDGPRGSLSMRPLGLAGQRSLQARLARLCRSHRSPSDRSRTGVSPHHTMTCIDVGGRVTDGAGSSVAAEWSDRARAVWLFNNRHRAGAVACTNLGGFGHCEWPSVQVRERREEATGRAQRHRDIAFAHRARNDPCDPCGQGGLVFLACAGPAVRRLGDSAPRWPAGSPAQWQRPRMRGCVMWRDRTTEPSRGRLRQPRTRNFPSGTWAV